MKGVPNSQLGLAYQTIQNKLVTLVNSGCWMVIGTDGKIFKGGIVVFDLEQASRFMGLAEGEPPLGMKNGQIRDHWDLTSEWWIKFGLVTEKAEPESGIAFEPIKNLLADTE